MSNYQRAVGEYVRPVGRFNLVDYCETLATHRPSFVAGTSYHQSAVARHADGESVDVEFVPEPNNPYDSWAVALDVGGARVGYLQAGAAQVWHDIVRSINSAGMSVTTSGTIRHTSWGGSDGGAGLVALEYLVPDWDELYDLAELSGLRDAHDAVMSKLNVIDRKRLAEDVWEGFNSRDLRVLREAARRAPGLTWSRVRGFDLADRVPIWHSVFIRQDIFDQREGGFQWTSQHRGVLEVVMGSVRSRAGRPGREPLMVQRQEFTRLITRGVSNSGACRMVGVNRRTGTRWRYGRTVTSSSGAELHDQPVTTTTKPGLSARFLSEDERVMIGDRVRGRVEPACHRGRAGASGVDDQPGGAPQS